MEQFGFAIIAIILIALGIAFVFAELESEEVEFFGPAAIFCLIIGVVFWFMSNPTSWLVFPEWTVIITIIIIAIVSILASFSALVTYKMIKLKKNPPHVLEIVGGIGQTIDEISREKEGYIQFHGEYWKAHSNITIGPGQKVKIIKKEGLILFIEPEEYIFCPNCGAKPNSDSVFCTNCGTRIKS
ncbi:MAG: zinc-ribbon domain-containing protein [Candidatus Helarchaeota archaeon]|nr:zinc-ribbon domain-containing protein [Candidatus Helarchaeota archaeon]